MACPYNSSHFALTIRIACIAIDRPSRRAAASGTLKCAKSPGMCVRSSGATTKLSETQDHSGQMAVSQTRRPWHLYLTGLAAAIAEAGDSKLEAHGCEMGRRFGRLF